MEGVMNYMNYGILCLVVALFVLASPLASGAANLPPLIPVEDFFRNPEVARFVLSPDGKKLAFLRPWERRLNVYVRDLETGEERRLTSVTDRDLSGFFWKGSDRIVFSRDAGGDENFHLFLVGIEGDAEPKELTPFPGVRTFVIDDLEEDPRHMLISMNRTNPEVFDVYRIDLETGELTLVAENPGNITGWMTDHDGRLRIAIQTDGVNRSLLYRPTEGEPFSTLLTTSFRNAFWPLMFSFDNRLLYVASNLDRDRMGIFTFDPDANEIIDLVFEHQEVDVSRLLSSRKRRVITGVVYTVDKTQIHFFDDERRLLQETLEERFPGHHVAVTGMDDDERRVVFATHSDRSRGVFYLYDRETGEIEKLADLAPWLNEEYMAHMTPIRFTSRDGLEIQGYLTLPLGVESVGLPVVTIPHGGPSARDVWGFDPEVQFLANRGAAVLQVNFRGSTGFGRAFWEAGFRQWGGDMQNDVTDGVKWLIEKGVADPERVAIYGASYGGYSALAGATFTPDLFAAAVSFVGPSNIFTLLESIPPYWEPMREMQYEMIGHPVYDEELLRAVSPVFHADRIRIPLLVAQGANDPRVNQAESDQIVEAVRRAGKDVVYIIKENEGHGFRNEENRFYFYRAMEEFFRKHIGLR